MRDYHINHNSCKISSENSNFNSNMPILESMEKEMKEMKRMMMLMLKNVEELKTEIKELKSLPKQEKKEVKEEVKEEKKEVKKEVKEVKEVIIQEKKEVKQEEQEDKSMFDQYSSGFIHIGGLSYTQMKAIKANFLKTKQIALPAKEFKNTPENIRRVKLYLGVPVKTIEEKKEETKSDPIEEEDEEEETDEDKAFGEYCDKDEYGVYHIGGIQSDSLVRMKHFYTKIPDDLLYGERKTKCTDKMDYLKREFSNKLSNNFSGSKDDFNKLKFYLEN